jgi:hypothetical protein
LSFFREKGTGFGKIFSKFFAEPVAVRELALKSEEKEKKWT